MSSRCYGLSQGIAGQAFVGYQPSKFCGSVYRGQQAMGYVIPGLGPDPIDPDEGDVDPFDAPSVTAAMPPSPGPIYQGKEKPSFLPNALKLAALGVVAFVVYKAVK